MTCSCSQVRTEVLCLPPGVSWLSVVLGHYSGCVPALVSASLTQTSSVTHNLLPMAVKAIQIYTLWHHICYIMLSTAPCINFPPSLPKTNVRSREEGQQNRGNLTRLSFPLVKPIYVCMSHLVASLPRKSQMFFLNTPSNPCLSPSLLKVLSWWNVRIQVFPSLATRGKTRVILREALCHTAVTQATIWKAQRCSPA